MIDLGKRHVLGVGVSALDYEAVTDKVIAAAREGRRLTLTALAVHGVMTGVRAPARRAVLNELDVVTPDGQPVRWALRFLHGVRLPDRVYGPTLTLRVLERCAAEGLPVYFHGSTKAVGASLVATLQERMPSLRVAGWHPSRFESVPLEVLADLCAEIKESGARVVFVGLGCPRQEEFAHAAGPFLDMPLLAVGAAFDYHAGMLRTPPRRLQELGLEWLWRLGLEPRRLWRRYLLLNPLFIVLVLLQRLGVWREPVPAPSRPPTSVPV
jgi:exopolysaccharide biosynthesis WecB/TagA/CpsF family protein